MSNKVDDFSDRLMRAAKKAGVPYSQAAIANFLGDVNRQTVDTWMNGSLPKADTLFRIAERFGVDPRWFATGEGEMLPAPISSDLSPAEVALLARFRAAGPDWRVAMDQLSRCAVGEATHSQPRVAVGASIGRKADKKIGQKGN